MNDLTQLASTAYNRAFELVEEGKDEDVLEGLELAATSLNLWRRVGTDKNVAIGLWLYSRALTKAGARGLAITAATECVRLAKIDATDWLVASSLEGFARAVKNTDAFAQACAAAEEAISRISDPDDRKLIADQFSDLR